MRSIKTKFITLILVCVLSAAAAIGAAGTLMFNSFANNSSAEIINRTCETEAEKINAVFTETEHSVNALAYHVLDQLNSKDLESKEYMRYYYEELARAAINYAVDVKGVISVYVRFDSDKSGSPTAGVFFMTDRETGGFVTAPLTDISAYDKTDREHVGWYYEPIENGGPLWMKPYHNRNVNVNMISYVVPLFKDGEPIGVVGMDIDFDALCGNISEIKVYESGFAFLLDEKLDTVYHPNMKDPEFENIPQKAKRTFGYLINVESSGDSLYEYDFTGGDKLFAFRPLSNGMRLVITAPKSEIYAQKNMFLGINLAFTVIISALAVTVTAVMTGRIVRPLKELNSAAEKIASGDLDAEITWHSDDELGTLAESFRKTTAALKKNDSCIKEIAYRDALTGARNTSAYREAVNRIDENIQNGEKFAVAVFDVNNLKITNDTYGHAYGDALITDASIVIRRSFEPGAVFRIGGDEFAVILEGEISGKCPEFMDKFYAETESMNALGKLDIKLSVAAGYAEFKPETDESYQSVFERADSEMYKNKKEMKAARI